MKYNKGIYTTMITPYTSEGKVDYDTARKYVRFYASHGCDGIFAVCQSSEIFFLSEDERAELNKTVWDEVQKIYSESGRRLTVVSSGHVADSPDDQARELNRIVSTGTDALILITNRLASETESDDIWIQNAEKLISMLPKDVSLGLYECPYPYKRLLTSKVLKWCLSTGRFKFIKDTCCDADLIRERLELLRGSDLYLFNANGQTLLESLKAGGAGYCGVMANFHPELYAWLYENYERNTEMAEKVAAFLGVACATEVNLPYPLTAKYHMCLRGIPTQNIARNRPSNALTPYARLCTQQIKTAAEYFLSMIGETK